MSRDHPGAALWIGLAIGLSCGGCTGRAAAPPAAASRPPPTTAPADTAPPPTPSSNPTSTSLPALSTDPRPGWTWYRTDAYSMAYPQQWLPQSARRVAYGLPSHRFVSPETETEVDVTLLGPIGKVDWLEWLRGSESRRQFPELLDYPTSAVSANATFHGRPAFFYFDPGALQWGDFVTLYFEHDGWVCQVMYRSQAPGLLPAETAIFAAMLDSFTLPDANGPTRFPLDLATGITLGASLPPDPTIALTGEVLVAGEAERVIVLRTPAQGFVTLTPAPGLPVDWAHLRPGTIVSARGQPGHAGALIVSQITLGGSN